MSKTDIVGRLQYVFIWQIAKEGTLTVGGCLHFNHSTGVRISEEALVSLSQYSTYILDQILRHGI